jgi:hypothetical protein
MLLILAFTADIPTATLVEPNIAARWGFFRPPDVSVLLQAPLLLAIDNPAVCGWVFGFNSIEQDAGMPAAPRQFVAARE